jgi:alkanesulfonate monooxygenase SsuD/methylene tetrahydromethanopterin reductase-like flavin-dependent oxidoreductase (luciferase family)
MQFGLFCTAQAGGGEHAPETGRGFHDYLELNIEAEALGYRSSFLVEHHFSGWNQVSATLTLLTCLAMRTTTLRLGSAVMVLPWHHPVLLAEQAATIDVMSGGRLDFGIGKGYRYNEFRGFNITQEEADARFEEALEVITRAWTSRERFSHRGKFWTFNDIVVEPPPAQQPHPPFWVAAGSEASIRRAAGRGFRLILDQYAAPSVIGERIATYRNELEAHGRAYDPTHVTVARQLYIAKDRADKEAALERQARNNERMAAVSRWPDRKGGSHILGYADTAGGTTANAMFGTPDEICETLEALRQAGAEFIILAMAGGREQLRRFARDIMPSFAGRRAARAVAAPREPTLA